ncbi:MAG: hypothetical protein C0489_11215 [Candidatus Accumulibacter sp.]|uniref:hypothetical protein n=1 Tax=Massilia sp. UYP11 TaxID=1756385 RepID=UPI001E106BEE|nr:hypothetical protein [Accumulibacter sp.]
MSKKKPASFAPFANEADVAGIGDLMLENRVDRITISGDVDLTADLAGLDKARRLHALLGEIVAALEARDLPDVLPPPEIKTIDNPFA